MHLQGCEAISMARIQTAHGRPALQAQFLGRHASVSLLEIDAWISSEMKAISPLVDRLMRLIEGSHCVSGNEHNVQLALQEAVTNAVVHGNRMDAHKLVQIRCRCELGSGVSIVVRDHGQGFDPNAVPDSLAVENIEAEHGRGIHLMKLAMDSVSFECGGTEVHMRKGPAPDQEMRLRSNNETVRPRFGKQH
jgi:serine/threonine-protein kinase RsbW